MRRTSIPLIVVALLSTLRTPSLAKDIPADQLRPPYHVTVYAKGSPITERAIAPGSREEEAITKWLRGNAGGWGLDLNTYAPNILIEGEGFTLNVSNRICVLNYRATKGAKVLMQVSRPTGKDDEILGLFPEKTPPR